ncbi:MAG: hypothetical protein HQ592_17970 [Planctomycetes bacterium]|nr:hypothetical protein [Planctomycetota bacterium]
MDAIISGHGSIGQDVALIKELQRVDLIESTHRATPITGKKPLPTHADATYTFNEITPVGPLEMVIRTGSRPKSVKLEPGRRRLRYEYTKGEIHCRLSRLEIHDIIVVE